MPGKALDRDGHVRGVYRAASAGTGKGQLIVSWTDVYDRLVEHKKIAFELRNSTDVPFTLDLRRAVAMRNTLTVHFSFTGTAKRGEVDRRAERAEITFITRPPDRTWWDYQIIMWQRQTAEQYGILKRLGITAGAEVYKENGQVPPGALLRNDLRWYVENIATDFYSAYHRLLPGRPKNWKFLEAKRLYLQNPSSREQFRREPSLSDPEWLKTVQDRLVATVRANALYYPLFYNLADEPGIADLAAFWDFDYSHHSLTGFRSWLAGRYGTLAALNQQWGSAFPSWDAIIPETTNEAMRRPDQNFSSWSDFKEWMDVAFARALKTGTDAVKSVDPSAYVAIEGAQQPGWGGYDYSRLTQALDVIEPYNMGGNVELIRSLHPKMVVLTTSGTSGAREKHRVWYELLHGSRGLILWDPKSEFVHPDGAIGSRGRDAEPYFREIRGGIGAALINTERRTDPIAILYSPASLRIEWMLEQKPEGEGWGKRSSSSDEDGPMRWLRESYCRLLEDLGRSYRFVTGEQVERGDLTRGGYHVLILPRASALSEGEARAMRAFVEQGGVLIADGNPGAYDAHGRKLSTPHLSDFFGSPLAGRTTERSFGRGKAIYLNVDALPYSRDRLLGKEQELLRSMGRLLQASLDPPAFRVTDPTGKPVLGVELHVLRNGTTNILALQSNRQLSLPNVGQSDAVFSKRFENPRAVILTLPGERYVYDMRAGRFVGKQNQLTVQLDAFEPIIFSAAPTPMPTLKLSGPRHLRAGQTGTFTLSFAGTSPAAFHVLHLDVLDPSGTVISHYSSNILASQGRATRVLLPLALNDRVGKWEIRVRDLLNGQIRVSIIEVSEHR